MRQIKNLEEKDKEINGNFIVTTCDSTDREKIERKEFDYVIVANGHNSIPHIPKIVG